MRCRRCSAPRPTVWPVAADSGQPLLDTPSSRLARLIALLTPLALLGGAYIAQYGFGLYPCEMCWWQRWPHFAALAWAIAAFIVPPPRLWVALSAFAIIASGIIGGFHAGVEYGFWQGVTGCAGAPQAGGGSALDAVIATPLIRCDAAPWHFLGVSLAGWNFALSLFAGIAIITLLLKRTPR